MVQQKSTIQPKLHDVNVMVQENLKVKQLIVFKDIQSIRQTFKNLIIIKKFKFDFMQQNLSFHIQKGYLPVHTVHSKP